GSLDAVVSEADLIMSILTPSEAEHVADDVAASMARTGARPVFVDCNATARQTALRIGSRIAETSANYVDAGICGRRIYCSGPDRELFESVLEHGLDIRRLGPEIRRSTGLEMVDSRQSKG